MTFHLHTESLPNVRDIVARYFDGFTLHEVIGSWLRQIRILNHHRNRLPPRRRARPDRHTLAYDIKHTNHQESVLVEIYPSSSTLI